MSEVTVESLPEEVVLEVFKWLDTKSLKNVMLTCKEWADYVRRSHQWTLNLTVASSLEGNDALMESANRKYSKAVIKRSMSMWDVMDVKTLGFLEKHGASIDELAISYGPWNWCEILNAIPNLKKVSVKKTESNNDVSDDELPPLCMLKTLQLDSKSATELKFFKKCQLYTLAVNTSEDYSDRFHQSCKGLREFVATQQDLKELKLDSGSCSALIRAPLTENSIPFRLKKLSLTRSASEMSTNIRNHLMEFMKLHVNTLEDLELHLKLPHNFYEFVFSEFKLLKALSLTSLHIPQARLKVNESVTSLQLIFGRYTDPREANAFVRNLPNVRKLVTNGNRYYPFAKYIADNMKQLKILDIYEVEADTFERARFPTLKSLRIRQLTGRVNWFAVAKNIPDIKELWIGNVGKGIENLWNRTVEPIYLDIAGITRNFKLRKLTIESSELKCDEKFFEVIRKNCPELKSLELNEKSLKVDISTVADIPGLLFRQF